MCIKDNDAVHLITIDARVCERVNGQTSQRSFVRLRGGIWPLPKLALPIRLHAVIITSLGERVRAPRLCAFDAFAEIKGKSAMFRRDSNGRSAEIL